MTRAAVESGFERFVDDAIEATASAFAVGNALRGSGGPPGAVDRLLSNSRAVERDVVRPELRAYRTDILAQFEAVLDAVESDEPFDAYADRVLARDRYVAALREDLSPGRRDEIEAALLERQRGLGDAVAPLVAADESAFWPAVEATFDRETAEEFVDEHFEFTAPLERFPDAFAFGTEVDPGDVLPGVGGLLGSTLPAFHVDFTEEARRAMLRAEREVSREARREIDRHFE
ncbi:hypothetical protein RYH80_00345 [Halobaculum sp. MBLA0147]|uniref:hypothetical protein n=1 Tax=Halobaculum sp. MBLA0147 TaxID=3079934 RepID=UPI0035255274